MNPQQKEVALHDSTIQALYGVGLQLENCLDLTDGSMRDLKRELEAAIESLYEVIGAVRSRIDHLEVAARRGVEHGYE